MGHRWLNFTCANTNHRAKNCLIPQLPWGCCPNFSWLDWLLYFAWPNWSILRSSFSRGKSLRPSGSGSQRLELPCVTAKDWQPHQSHRNHHAGAQLADGAQLAVQVTYNFNWYRGYLAYRSCSNFSFSVLSDGVASTLQPYAVTSSKQASASPSLWGCSCQLSPFHQ